MKFVFIQTESVTYPARVLCRVMQAGKSEGYAWTLPSPTLITLVDLHLHRSAKELFHANRDSLGSREPKKLRKEDFSIILERKRKLMKNLN